MREALRTEIALDALAMAIQRQQPAPGLVHHSGHGIQYAVEVYRSAHEGDDRRGNKPTQSSSSPCFWTSAPSSGDRNWPSIKCRRFPVAGLRKLFVNLRLLFTQALVGLQRAAARLVVANNWSAIGCSTF